MTNIIIIAVIALVLILAVGYIVRQKRSGARCVGCPHSKNCRDEGCSCIEK